MADQIGEFLRFFVERYDRPQAQQILQALSALTARLDIAVGQYESIEEKLGAIMATLQQFETALGRIDTATTAAANLLRELRDRVAELETNAGITATDEASILGRLDQVAASLEQMGTNPENPVPVEPEPEPNPTPEPPAA